ncbi:MAG: hypothetical protein LBK67_04820 [Coriobacteriales bacterium]|jgi:hypothetical protein|nr:hypothetical protein [Coriobacteriales bacterium]
MNMLQAAGAVASIVALLLMVGEWAWVWRAKRLSQKSSYPSNSKKPQADNLAWQKLLG